MTNAKSTSEYVIEINGGSEGWAGTLGWRPIYSGFMNQTEGSDTEASTVEVVDAADLDAKVSDVLAEVAVMCRYSAGHYELVSREDGYERRFEVRARAV